MKKSLKIILISCIIAVLSATNIFAMSNYYNPNLYTSVDIQSKLLPETAKNSIVHETGRRRGSFFAGTDLIIKNNSNGNVGVFAKAYMDISVEEAYITIYLDRWDATVDRWKQVSYYDAEFYESDYPNGLVEPSVDVEFKKVEKGYYYRARAVFSAMHNDNFEGFSPVTDGILID